MRVFSRSEHSFTVYYFRFFPAGDMYTEKRLRNLDVRTEESGCVLYPQYILQM